MVVRNDLQRQAILKAGHIVAGKHLGINITMNRIKKDYYWTGTYSDIKKMVSSKIPTISVILHTLLYIFWYFRVLWIFIYFKY